MKIGRFEIKPVKNTVWDFVVPLSLVAFALIVFLHAFYSNLTLSENILTGLIYILIFLIITFFFTRFLRIFLYLLVPFLLIIIDTIFEINIFNIPRNILLTKGIGIVVLYFSFAFLTAGFFLGNLALLFSFGNNLTVKKIKKPSLLTYAISFGIYGIGLDILYLYTFPQSGTTVNPFLFEEFYKSIGVPLLTPFFTIILTIIGLVVGKYKEGGDDK